jgi:hypothetical protein
MNTQNETKIWRATFEYAVAAVLFGGSVVVLATGALAMSLHTLVAG